jgi:hypothetical protein
MLAKARKLRRNIASALLLVTAIVLVSCATQKDPPRLVSDPDERRDSAIPWNRQEKWEIAPDAAAGLGPTGSSDTR